MATAIDLPKLEERMDWGPFMKGVEYAAGLLGIWDYIDPLQTTDPEEPNEDTALISEADLAELRAKHPVPIQAAEEEVIAFEARKSDWTLTSRLNIEALARRKERQCIRARQDYDNTLKNIQRFAFAIQNVTTLKWKERIHRLSSPREMLVVLKTFVSPIPGQDGERAKAAFLKIAHEANSQRDWIAWADDFHVAYADCVQWKAPEFSESSAVRQYLVAIRPDFEWLWDKQFHKLNDVNKDPSSESGDTLSGLLHDFRAHVQMKKSFDLEKEALGESPTVDLPPPKTKYEVPETAKKNAKANVKEPKGSAKKSWREPSTQDSGPSWQLCPGCQQSHVVDPKKWWKNCWQYHSMTTPELVPNTFHPRASTQQLIRERFNEFVEEKYEATKWSRAYRKSVRLKEAKELDETYERSVSSVEIPESRVLPALSPVPSSVTSPVATTVALASNLPSESDSDEFPWRQNMILNSSTAFSEPT